MAYSITSGYGFSVSHENQLLSCTFKYREDSESKIHLNLQSEFSSVVLTDDGNNVSIDISPGADIESFVNFCEEIVSTYKKYKS